MDKILVTGGTGLVGKAIESLSENFHFNFIFLSSKECDLSDFNQTDEYFNKIRPKFVIHLAACVGGLYKNMKYKVDMYEKNININNNVLKCSHKYNVEKVISCLSTCIFPDKIEYPINETMLHDGPPHNSNDSYAYSKRMLEVLSKAYQEQYNSNFICIIPTNIYGPYDNFSLEDGHVIPSLIHRCYDSFKKNEKFVVRGSGKPLRQFIFSHDLAKLILWTLLNYKYKDNLILSVGEKEEVRIGYIAYQIAKYFNYENNIIFDESYSDGQYKKTVDNSKLMELIKNFNFTHIDSGIKDTIEWFVNNYESCRK